MCIYDKSGRDNFSSFRTCRLYGSWPKLWHDIDYSIIMYLVLIYKKLLPKSFTFQMSEQLNQELSLTGKIPSGLFNAMFEFSGCWQKDAAYTKTLAFDGMFITLYTVALEKSQMVLKDHVKKEVPSSWEPAALARYFLRLSSLEVSSYTITAGIPYDLSEWHFCV